MLLLNGPVPLPEKTDFLQAASYFGAKDDVESVRDLLSEADAIVRKAAIPRFACGIFNISEHTGFLCGNDIKLHLKGCDRFVLMGATLGVTVDSVVKKCGIKDIALGSAAECVANVLVESVCDGAEELLRQKLLEEGLFATCRYSPGYGDFPLEKQRDVDSMLGLSKNLGITVTGNFLMIPRKSVTAVLGVSDKKVTGHLAGCSTCALRETCDHTKCRTGS